MRAGCPVPNRADFFNFSVQIADLVLCLNLVENFFFLGGLNRIAEFAAVRLTISLGVYSSRAFIHTDPGKPIVYSGQWLGGRKRSRLKGIVSRPFRELHFNGQTVLGLHKRTDTLLDFDGFFDAWSLQCWVGTGATGRLRFNVFSGTRPGWWRRSLHSPRDRAGLRILAASTEDPQNGTTSKCEPQHERMSF